MVWDCRSKHHDPIQTLGDAKDSVTYRVALLSFFCTCVLCSRMCSRAFKTNRVSLTSRSCHQIRAVDVTDTEILTGSVDGCVRLYDIRAGRMRLDFLKDPVTSVSFSHDRECILASTLNSTIRLVLPPSLPPTASLVTLTFRGSSKASP